MDVKLFRISYSSIGWDGMAMLNKWHITEWPNKPMKSELMIDSLFKEEALTGTNWKWIEPHGNTPLQRNLTLLRNQDKLGIIKSHSQSIIKISPLSLTFQGQKIQKNKSKWRLENENECYQDRKIVSINATWNTEY